MAYRCPNTALKTAPNAINQFPLYSNASQMLPPNMPSVTNDITWSPGTGLSHQKDQLHLTTSSVILMVWVHFHKPCCFVFMHVWGRSWFNEWGFLFATIRNVILSSCTPSTQDNVTQSLSTHKTSKWFNGWSLTLCLFYFSNWGTN